MKYVFTLMVLLGFTLSSFAASRTISWAEAMGDQPEISALSPELTALSAEEFVSLSSREARAITGERLSIRESLQLRAAQRLVKKQMNPTDGGISKGLYVLLALIGLGWIAIGVITDFSGNDWIINLVLTLLGWLPGVIHAFIKMKDYY